ncbi:tyrosine-protein phosphatase [Nocardia sp. R7R-8]|uniref:tyrosine-protein phosphatase n=1 Tax=Nocardia sp. R7R-8 TaxID=3459304 RepID=UPI00403D6234
MFTWFTRMISGLLAGTALLLAPTGCSTAPDQGTPAVVQPATAVPRLSSLDNFRDVAGSSGGYATTDGRHLRTNVIYRSNALTPNETDLATLTQLHPSTVYDLRTPDESSATPDHLPAATAYRQISVIGDGRELNASLAALTSAEDAYDVMRGLYRGFVAGTTERQAFAALLTGLANENGPVVIHCTAGKDRTGFATYLLHQMAGVSPEVTMTDFLESNQRSAQSIARTLDSLRQSRGPAVADAMTPMLTVDRSYLETAITEIELRYGNVTNYLHAGLGLQDSTLQTLRQRLISA